MSGPYPDNGRDAYEDMCDFYSAEERRKREKTHDLQCESELTPHGYTPCRCAERANGEALWGGYPLTWGDEG